MRKLISCACLVATVAAFSGCVMPAGPMGGVAGSIYTNVSGPGGATSNAGSSKKGQAMSKGVLGFAWGDSSIKTAADSAGITKIHHVDYHTTAFLGVYAETVVTVYGE